MALDYASDIQPLEDLGKDDDWIVEALNGLTVKDIPATELYGFLRDADLWTDSPDGLTGKLQVAWDDPTNDTPPLTKKVLAVVHSVCFSAAATHLQTTRELKPNGTPKGVQFARNLFLTLGRLLTNTDITQVQIDDLYDLGGGLRFNVVEQDIVDERAAWVLREVQRTRVEALETLGSDIQNDYIKPALSDPAQTAATVTAAIKAGL